MPKTRLRLTDLTPALVPIWHVAPVDVPSIGATPVEVHSVALPAAGSYFVELQDTIECGTLTGSRTATWTLSATNFVSCSMNALQTRSGVSPLVEPAGTTNGHTISATTLSTNNRVRVASVGLFVVSAAAVLSITLAMSAELCTLKLGSFLRARKYA